MEKRLLSGILHNRTLFNELLTYTDGTDLSDQGQVIFKEIQNYYELDKDAQSVDKEILISKLKTTLKNPKIEELFINIVKDLAAVSIPNVRDEFLGVKKEEISMSLSSSLLGNKDALTNSLIDQWKDLYNGVLEEDSEIEEYEDMSLPWMLDSLDRGNLISLSPSALNDRIDGGASKGDHIVIAGRVEDGKSLMAIDISCHCCKNGHKVLYIGNEESRKRMLPRFASNMTLMNRIELEQNPDEAEVIMHQNGWDNLIFVSIPAGTLSQIESLIIKHKPDVVVLDQLRNISTGLEDGPKQLEKVAKGARRLIKKYDYLGISVTQLNNDAARINKLVGEMSDIDSSKVGIPAQADLIIMIGSNEEYRQTNKRMISLPKNKLSGTHGYFPVKIDPTISRVENLD